MTGKQQPKGDTVELKLNTVEWIKLVAVVLIASAPAIAFAVRTDARSKENALAAQANTTAIKELTDSIKLLVRHDERIGVIRSDQDRLRDTLNAHLADPAIHYHGLDALRGLLRVLELRIQALENNRDLGEG